jgi:hypothetical protein
MCVLLFLNSRIVGVFDVTRFLGSSITPELHQYF